jgi:uncharacterized protein with ACT and thioredoxin-like domain
MRGFPKTIGTKQDLENLLALPELAEQACAKLKELKSASQVWVATGKLADGKVGSDQLELREDPQTPYIRLDLATLQPDAKLAVADPIQPKLADPGLAPEGVKDAE